MNKQEFLRDLKAKLSGLPEGEVEERLVFYSEMIDDRIEEGQTEEAAVLGVGSVDEIAAQIISDIPLAKIAKERIKPKRRLTALEISLLVLGFPIWFSLAVGAFVVIISLFVVLWSLIVSIWAVFAALAACAVYVISGIIFAVRGNIPSGAFLIGAGFITTGLSIFLFFGCVAATKGMVLLTKKIAIGIKKCFIKKENKQ